MTTRSRRLAVGAGATTTLLTGLLFVPPAASAAMTVSGTGSFAASAASVNTPSAPSLAVEEDEVVVSWPAVTLSSGVAVEGYRVLRHVGDDVREVCAAVAPDTSCSDPAPAGGPAQYGVIAYRAGWNGPESPLSDLASDATAPTTSITRSPAGADATWHSADVHVTLQASDDGNGVQEVRYAVNNGTVVVTPGAQVELTLSREDANTLVYWAVDNAGNVEAPSNTATVKIDKTSPVTTASPTGTLSNGWFSTNVTLALSATDTSPVAGAASSGVHRVEYQLNGTAGPWITYSGAIDLTTEGQTTVHYRAVDGAGNVETGNGGATKSILVMIDKTRPTAPSVATSPAGANGSNGWFTTAPSVSLTGATDVGGSGVARVEYQLNGTSGTWTTYTGPFQLSSSTTSAGTTVHLRSVDTAGNVSLTGSAVVKVDNAMPEVTPLPADGAVFAKNEWKNSAKACQPVGGNPGSARLCVTVADAISGLDTAAQVQYTLVRTSSTGQVQACWNGLVFSTEAGCSPTSVTMARSGALYSSQLIGQDLLGPVNNQLYYYRWTVTGVRDLAGNAAPAASFTFQLTG